MIWQVLKKMSDLSDKSQSSRSTRMDNDLLKLFIEGDPHQSTSNLVKRYVHVEL